MENTKFSIPVGRSDGALRSTIAERVANALRERIIMAYPGFTPGSRVLPAQVAADLDVSMTPVKDALRMLSAEGLVDLGSRRGARVVHLEPEDLIDLIDVRFGIERLALQMARRRGRLTARSIGPLESCMAVCDAALKRDDVLTYRQGDTDFHQALVDLSQSPHLRTSYRTLLAQAQIRHAYRPRSQQSMRDSLDEHHVLVSAVRAEDETAVQRALVEHWRHSYGRLMESLRDLPNVEHLPMPLLLDQS
jgi:DNA-binding GntR family transcriptional regulator